MLDSLALSKLETTAQLAIDRLNDHDVYVVDGDLEDRVQEMAGEARFIADLLSEAMSATEQAAREIKSATSELSALLQPGANAPVDHIEDAARTLADTATENHSLIEDAHQKLEREIQRYTELIDSAQDAEISTSTGAGRLLAEALEKEMC